MKKTDVLIIGSGHNGLICATLLAKKGLRVTVVEEKPVLGGATRTEYPFKKAPRLGTSTASYLLGMLQPEVLEATGAKIPLIRRDPHYFLPTLDGRYLLFGSDKVAMREQFLKFFSEADWKANERLNAELEQLRADVGPSWLEEPMSVEATAERFVRPALRQVFIDLVRQPVEDYLARFDFKSELLLAMYAVTDGFSGLSEGFGMKGTGMNFLVHNMCRLPGGDGTYFIVKGGMGTVAAEFARTAREAGAELLVNAGVERVIVSGGRAEGVILRDGRELRANVVISNADPFRMRELVGRTQFPAEFNSKLDSMKREGTTMKVNLALSRLPKFKCLPEDRGQHNGTVHLLPQTDRPIEHIRRGFEEVRAGRFAEFPTIEWYFHTQADPSLRDPEGNHNSAFFVQWVPYDISEDQEQRYVKHLLGIAEQFAPGFLDSVIDTYALTPKKIERELGMTYGHIHHVDNSFVMDERVPYALPIPGLYSCSSGTHPGGGVIGCAGHNSAKRVLKDLGVR